MTLNFNGQVLKFGHINVICGREPQVSRLFNALFSHCSNPEMFLWGTYKSVEVVNSEMVKGRQWFDQLLIHGLEYKRTTDDIKNACIAIKKIADNGIDIFVSIEKMESLVELCSLVDSLTIVGDTIRQYGSIPLSSPIES